ncbi:MAG: DUF1501 domain-containing protein [Planctomycetales bacterium]|nr:DUF1501 domain-containing protein [Planctomycetales bacterium]
MHHPSISRRAAIQAGGIGLLGMGMNHLQALRAEAVPTAPRTTAKSCIFIFLSGGLAQHDSFDMKPDASDEIRGEFRPTSTKTPGIQICEHLPMLAERSEHWSLCRSLTHPSNEHSAGHCIMLTGRSSLPPGFNPSQPLPTDFPSIPAIAGAVTRPRNNLPPAIVLPERLVHRTGRVIPGQFGGIMGSRRDPWFIEASSFHTQFYGAFPEYSFDHQERSGKDSRTFEAPSVHLPEWLPRPRLNSRLDLINQIEGQQKQLDQLAETEDLDRFRAAATSLLTHPKVKWAFDVTRAEDAVQDRYGRNAFGWSLLMARRLVETGVNLVQVNLGNNETWDTHGNAFPHLKDRLFPPTDRALSALLDDLRESGMLDDTLIVVAGEFGRTPKISLLPQHYAAPGRDHWGAVQSVLLAGGGVQGGRVIGASDNMGAFPANDPQKPENLAATIYRALGLPKTTAWYDELERPHFIYHGEPIPGLL